MTTQNIIRIKTAVAVVMLALFVVAVICVLRGSLLAVVLGSIPAVYGCSTMEDVVRLKRYMRLKNRVRARKGI